MDDIDRAQIYDQTFRDIAIAAALRHGNDEDPLIINGVRCCLDCEEPIPEGRLELEPDARRCVPCQTKHEKNNRRKGKGE